MVNVTVNNSISSLLNASSISATVVQGSLGQQAVIARDQAFEYANQAANSAAAAANSEIQAANSAAYASNSEIQAANSAAQSANSAVQSANSAAQSANSASQSANSASQSANSAVSAANSATQAANSAVQAANSAVYAANSQINASNSAAQAANSAAQSANSAVYAANSAVNAANSEIKAANSASQAANSATQAANSAINSANSATQAANSQVYAANSAVNAANSATQAANSATQAANSAVQAANSATQAANSAVQAANSQVYAANAAINAANSEIKAANSAAYAANSALYASNSEIQAANSATQAANSAVQAANSAFFANTSKVSAELARDASVAASTISTTQAQTAQAQASLAQGYAASAASVVQQDLSGITAQALHRSPNAITAMAIYDTSKDSDGGAWTEKCQHTSWWNEPLMGKWLGAWASEADARNLGPALFGPELVTNGNFSNGGTGWSAPSHWTFVNNRAEKVTASDGEMTQSFAGTTGKMYRISWDQKTNGSFVLRLGSLDTNFLVASGNGTKVWYGTLTTTAAIRFEQSGTSAGDWIDNVSVREITGVASFNDYFQLTTDGKFYRLWKNLLTQSAGLASTFNYTGGGAGATLTDNQTIGGQTALKIAFAGQAFVRAGRSITTPALAQSVTISLDFYNESGISTSLVLRDSNNTFIAGSVALPTTTGWSRVSLSGTFTGGTGGIGFYIGGDGQTGNVYIKDIQLEYGLTATAYQPKAAEGTTSEIFRGNKADFPRLAAIVAEASNVNIYDLTEPGRPMWMRFTAPGSSNALGYFNVSCVSALNGLMLAGSSSFDLYAFNLHSDTALRVSTTGQSAVYRGTLADRNSLKDWTISNPFSGNIAGRAINAIAMTVLPDAPVDPATGLRVPTIAVATGGGVSVIKHNGTVVNSSLTNSYNHIYIDKNILMFSRTGSRGVYYATNPGALGSSFNVSLMGGDPDQYQAWNPTVERFSSRATPMRFAAPSVYRKLNHEALPVRGLNMAVASGFNTGWLPGDIRRCYLSDATVESVSGAELVTNGTFDTDTTGWSASDDESISVVSGRLRLTYGPNGGRGFASQQLTGLVIGKVYAFRVGSRYKGTNAAVGVRISNSPNLGAGILDFYSFADATNEVGYFTATATTVYIYLYGGYGTSGTYVEADDISLQEAVLDRSYKAAGATITGTITRSQLASGTSLVGYSGFSASNYLREPYSAGLDFGTGEWSCSAWVNVPATLPAVNFPVTGPELITNGTFATDTAWAKSTGWSISGGVASCSAISTGSNLSQTISSVVVGKWYEVSFEIISTAVSTLRLDAFGGGAGNWFFYEPGASGVKTVRVRATNQVLNIATYGNNVSTIDNVSVKEIATAPVIDRAHSSGAKLTFGVSAGGQLEATAFDGTTTRTVTTSASYNTATWLKAEACYTTDGTLSIRVNGREVATARGNPLLTLNNSSAVLTIGNSFALDAPFPGSIALLKLGATVPTPEQSVFMYEQEKQLFRAGAQSVLPDSGSIVDMAYDDATDRWVAVSATNESYWTGLIRNTVTPVPAGSYTRVTATSGIELVARSTTNPGVDVSIPAYGLREELVKRAEAAARLTKELVIYDYVGGFTANTTNGSTAITNVANLTYPASYIGARISGSGIPANTTIVSVSGTTIYLSAPATATATGVSISFLDFELPVGMETKAVSVSGSIKQEGSTKDYTRLYDGFIETVRFAVAPGATAWVQIQAQRITL